MPLLPLTGSTPLDGGVLPVRNTADVLAVLPVEVRRSTQAPIRDALVAAFTEIQREYQRRSRRAAACSDVLRAQGYYLSGLAADHEVFARVGEKPEDLRARLLGILDLVTPKAIMAGVNAILAPFTAKRARYFESNVDCYFVEDGTATWHSFVYNDVAAASPYYPDRLYPDDAEENEGDAIEDREVLGAWVFADQLGRYFVIRLPLLSSTDELWPFAFDGTATDVGMFVADGSDTDGAESDGSVTTFVFEDESVARDLYAAIVSLVDLLKGQGVRWQAYVDPLL